MSNIFVVSDTHFGHANILKFLGEDGTPFRGSLFDSTEEMDEAMVRNWNSVVTDSDVVYHLGDVYFGSPKNADAILSRLKGRKRLLLGNHDDGKDPVLQKYFQKIMMWRMLPEFNCLLTHIPAHESNLFNVDFNLHGHIHEKPSPSPKHINCSVEVQHYIPKLIETLVPNLRS